MRSSELRAIEEIRAAQRETERAAATTTRVVRTKASPQLPGTGWNPTLLRSEVEGEFRSHGARVVRGDAAR